MTAALPLLETPRLRLRPRMLADLEDCVATDREPGTLDWIDWPEVEGGWHDMAAHRAFVRRRILAPWPAGLGYWTVTPRGRRGAFLGWVLLIPEDGRGPEVEIGWRLRSAARGRGYATEAARALLSHGLATLALARIVAEVKTANAPSRRVAEKIGMRALPGGGPCGAVRFVAEAGRC